ncbi:MAG TPA: hypothetical protein VGM39_11485 [Kofleriaceae bacterium]|jgi:DNA-directed RNA polymerase specialized sigma24 family protein
MTSLDELWPLFRAVAADGEAAWPALVVALFPPVLKLATYQPIGRLRNDKDAAHEIATRVLERLHARELAAVKKLCVATPTPRLDAWLRVLVRNSSIDVLRASPEFERANDRREARWLSIATLASTPGAPPDSLAEKRREVISFVMAAVSRVQSVARDRELDDALALLSVEWDISRIHVRRLAQRGTRFVAVLESVLAGHTYPEVAEVLGITRREVELSVQYVEELLAARRFAAN